MGSQKDAERKKAGTQAELLAKSWMQSKGFSILHQNYRFGRCEVDLICKKDDLLVFVEVKYRSATTHGQPEDHVSPAQQSRIITAAEQFMIEIDHRSDVRFDVISITAGECLHFEDAFH